MGKLKVLLFSGGVESTCLALLEQPDLAVNIDYGQVCATGERNAAEHIARLLSLPLKAIDVPMAHLGRGDLTGTPQPPNDPIPEHWPFRNQMLVTIAAMAQASHEECELLIGTVSGDSVHADGHEGFVDAMSQVLNRQYSGFSLRAPAIKYSTESLLMRSGVSQDLLGWTFSCHRSNVACGRCRGCNKTRNLIENFPR